MAVIHQLLHHFRLLVLSADLWMLTVVHISGPGASHICHLGTKSSCVAYPFLCRDIRTNYRNCVSVYVAKPHHALMYRQLVEVELPRGSHTQQLSNEVPFSTCLSFIHLPVSSNYWTSSRKHVAFIGYAYF